MAKITVGNNIKLNASGTSQLQEFKAVKQSGEKVSMKNMPIFIAAVILVLVYVYSLALFTLPTTSSPTLADIVGAATEKLGHFTAFLSGDSENYSSSNIIRYTVIVLAGASLASAGVLFQGSFKNIIASPTTMGVQSGATLGNSLYLLFFAMQIEGFVVLQYDNEAYQNMNFFQQNLQQVFAMIGSFIAIMIVIAITSALGKGHFTSANILFGGTVFSSLAGSITSIIQYYFLFTDPDNSRVTAMRVFTMGSFDRVLTVNHLFAISVFLVPSLIAIIFISAKLNILVLGEEEAMSMGLNVKLYRNLIIGIGTLMAATVFAFCGSIGFVGFIVPQICRRFVGPDFRRLIIMSMFVGGILMILVYDIALYIGFSAYLNMITSFIGCAMMVYSFLKGNGGRISAE